MTKNNTPENMFLHETSPDFHASRAVNEVVEYLRANGEDVPDDAKVNSRVERDAARVAKVGVYMEFLADRELGNDGLFTGSTPSIEQQVAYRTIKPERIPESYFASQRQFTSTEREASIEAIRGNQAESLRSWMRYLGSGDAAMYEDWFKQYVYSGVVKLADYDIHTKQFRARSAGTVGKYPEINREAISMMYDRLMARVDGQPEDDEDWRRLIAGKADFNALYAHALREAASGLPTPEDLATTQGSWRVFEQSSDRDDARTLVRSLEGRGTGWCTTGLETATYQLSGGDFMVYFTENTSGEAVVPRIAIRMKNGVVDEVRGIASTNDAAGARGNTDQDIEVNMLDILEERLLGLPEGELYLQAAKDMKELVAINDMLSRDSGAELSHDQLRFLYEIDRPMLVFGYNSMPNVSELKAKRDIRKDLATVLDLREDQVALTSEELRNSSNEIVYLYDHLDVGFCVPSKKKIAPQWVAGRFSIDLLPGFSEGASFPRRVDCDVHLRSVASLSAKGIALPEYVGGDIWLNRLSSAKDLTLPIYIGGQVHMHGLASPEGLDVALQNFEGAITMRCRDGTIKKAVEGIQKNNPKLQVEWV